MEKVHIRIVGTNSVFMTHTNDFASDSLELIKHIEFSQKMNADIEPYSAGWVMIHSWIMHTWFHLGVKSVISYAKWIINEEGETERIEHWVNKMWKEGGDINAKTEKKFSFLCQNGRRVQVGMYLRNQNIKNEAFK